MKWCCVLIFLFFSIHASEENLARNGTFNSVSGWKLSSSIRATDKLKAGNKVLELRPNRSGYSSVGQKIKFQQGKYEVTFRARTHGGDGSNGFMSVRVATKMSKSLRSQYYDSNSISANREWKEFKFTFDIAKKSKRKYLIFRNGNTKQTKLHIDDVIVKKID